MRIVKLFALQSVMINPSFKAVFKTPKVWASIGRTSSGEQSWIIFKTDGAPSPICWVATSSDLGVAEPVHVRATYQPTGCVVRCGKYSLYQRLPTDAEAGTPPTGFVEALVPESAGAALIHRSAFDGLVTARAGANKNHQRTS